ncbi:glycerophosphodiester phosphodiesterase [Agromyces atrinae]|uniref:glycerophosphodiester phosphodiesterase family protein n=1 Tax=Agromyces atrinae TaxID=592376 RepID=UPI001F568247|nr:glycerophosphodiester phosphodiesterase family protein [Agromyces atrinae]MCI2957882.1 glycerophosphodiester phosphodiesterase [Agromyces atrinae]
MKPLVIGHRGASGYRPEHTRSAYELAVALGADAVEPDIVATRDGVLVLRHENEISGTTDVAERAEFASRRTTREVDGQRLTGWFTEDFTWAELATLRARERIGAIRASSATFDGRFPILRLADLFELLDTASEERGSGVGMVAEIKHATHFAEAGLPLDELFAAEAAEAGWALDDDRVTFEAFELDVLDRLGARSAGSRRVFLLEDAGAPFDQVRARGADALPYAQYLTPAGLDGLVGRVDGISIPKNLVLATSGPGLIGEAHARDLAVFTWTLRPENRFLAAEHRRGRDKAAFGDWPTEFAAILGAGVDGIFVDHPDLGVEARASFIG